MDVHARRLLSIASCRCITAPPRLSAGATAFAAGASLVLRRKFSKREFWTDVRRYDVTVCQYVGEICRFLLTVPPQPDDRTTPLRKMVGAGMSPEVWEHFVERFGRISRSMKAGARPKPIPTPSTSTTGSAPAAAYRSGKRPTCASCATTLTATAIRATRSGFMQLCEAGRGRRGDRHDH